MKIFADLAFQKWLGTILSILVGSAIWFSMRLLTGEDDPQSHADYWRIGYPAMMLFSFGMGVFFNLRPWRWGLYIIIIQLALGLLTLKGDPNLLPVGLIIHAVIAIPCVLAGYFGSWLSSMGSGTRNGGNKGIKGVE